MKRIGNKISYIRKPLAKRSLPAALFAALSFLLTGISIGVSYAMGGNAPLWDAAVGFTGLLFGAASAVYGGLALAEREKEYILAKVSLSAAGVILFLWVIVLAGAIG